jgi:hypothetical protein
MTTLDTNLKLVSTLLRIGKGSMLGSLPPSLLHDSNLMSKSCELVLAIVMVFSCYSPSVISNDKFFQCNFLLILRFLQQIAENFNHTHLKITLPL